VAVNVPEIKYIALPDELIESFCSKDELSFKMKVDPAV
jgi:hypothetical protein